MVATASHSVTIVLWKETAFPLWRAMDKRWKRNVVSMVSSVMAVMRLPTYYYYQGLVCVSSAETEWRKNRSHLARHSIRPRLQQLASVDLNLSVGSDIIRPSTVVRDIGVFVDAELTFREHVRRVINSCFFQLRRLRQIRWHVNRQVMKQLINVFVISRHGYCNSI